MTEHNYNVRLKQRRTQKQLWCNILIHCHFPVHLWSIHGWNTHLCMQPRFCSTLFSMYSVCSPGVHRNETSVYICTRGVVEYCTGQNATPGDWLQYSAWFTQCRPNFHLIIPSLKYWVVFQNLTDDQIDDVIVAYEPTNVTDPTETKIAISDMIGDIYFVCVQQKYSLK